MQKVINVYKPVGMTPLQLIKVLQQKYPEYALTKIGYAGRLDPMAHGVMLLLVYPETQKRSHYQALSKVYRFECILGISTDTSDMLGLPTAFTSSPRTTEVENSLTEYISSLPGKHKQEYPVYSSKTVEGKPLFWWAKNNKLSEISIPHKTIIITDANLVNIRETTFENLHNKFIQNIALVEGDFRQKHIVEKWSNLLLEHKSEQFTVATIEIACESGTYVRAICCEIGKHLGIGAAALDINRLKVGDYSSEDSLKLM